MAALAVTAMIVVAGAQATSTRATRGDAQAVFDASMNGGWAILLHSGKVVGPAANAPADGIRITLFVDGHHYCSLDWHVMAVNLFDGNFPGESRTPHEIASELSTINEAIWVDGVPLDTTRGPVKPFLNPESLGLVNGFGFATGRVMAPSELSVGTHTVHTETSDPTGIIFTSDITFTIDPAGVGACV
jgi:hypothetical protein